MQPESRLMRAIRIALLRDRRVHVTRNNTGMAEVHGQFIRFGLGKGGADLVGMQRGSGRAVAFEVKTATGRVSDDQKKWGAKFTALGGFYRVVRSPEEAIACLEQL